MSRTLNVWIAYSVRYACAGGCEGGLDVSRVEDAERYICGRTEEREEGERIVMEYVSDTRQPARSVAGFRFVLSFARFVRLGEGQLEPAAPRRRLRLSQTLAQLFSLVRLLSVVGVCATAAHSQAPCLVPQGIRSRYRCLRGDSSVGGHVLAIRSFDGGLVTSWDAVFR